MTNEIESSSRCSTGLTPAVSVLLIYLFGWVSGLIFLLIEKQNRSVRFHAVQSIVLNIALLGLFIAMQIVAFVPFIGVIFSAFVIPITGLGTLILIIVIIVRKFQGVDVRLPLLGDIADRALSTV